MKIDGGVSTLLSEATQSAKAVEAAGYDGAFTAELAHDPFLPLALASEATERIELGTSIAVAFARNPMLLANLGWDLQEHSGGRFVLGLGSQIKPHITKRFSMEWSQPAARMREFILAMHAIWDSWLTGDKLDFRGDFYKHVLMTPMFSPNPKDFPGKPKVFLASVGPLMTKVCGEVADGWFSHGFTTAAYLEDISLPALRKGTEAAGRSADAVEVALPAMIVTGTTEEEMATAAAAVRKQIAFYGSTPSYKGVLDHHGWGDLQPELNRLSKEGRWDDMADLIDDDVLDTIGCVAPAEEIAGKLKSRYGHLVDRMTFYAPYEAAPDVWLPVIDELKSD